MCTAEGQAALRRVLLAFSVQNPKVGYCQSMNFLAATLLLALDRAEEKAFWVLVCLIDDGGVLPSHVQYTISHRSSGSGVWEREPLVFLAQVIVSGFRSSALRHGACVQVEGAAPAPVCPRLTHPRLHTTSFQIIVLLGMLISALLCRHRVP